MHEEQRGMDLVGIVERAVIHIKCLVFPGIAVRHGDLTIGIAPIALTPVAGVIADTGMRDGCRKEVCLGLQVLCHEATVGGTDTPYLFCIDEWVFFAEAAGTLNDVIRYVITSGVDVTSGELLPETGCATRLNYIHHIT